MGGRTIKKRAAFGLILALFSFGSLSCPEKSKLIGSWQLERINGQPPPELKGLVDSLPEDSSLTITINQDRTLAIEVDDRPIGSFNWQAHGSRLIVGNQKKADCYQADFIVSSNQLHLRFCQEFRLILSRTDRSPSTDLSS